MVSVTNGIILRLIKADITFTGTLLCSMPIVKFQ